jgi:hypothetical protein
MSISSASAKHIEKQHKYFHYEADPLIKGAMGLFLTEIHGDFNNGMEVVSVKFTLRDDKIEESGLVTLLNEYLPKRELPRTHTCQHH